jgi:hypothetical protein
MSLKKLSIAIISDLHCHPSRNKKEEGENTTYLLTDMLRSPAENHPVESFLKVIKTEELEVNITLCPGDFTDKSNRQGFLMGWSFCLEMNRELNSDEIIATIGNHDVDSFGSASTYSFENAKGIKQGFPLKEEKERNMFWAQGCVFLERENFRILVINSSHFHYNKDEAKKGKVDHNLISYIDEYMERNIDDKISLALSHHHPVDHSRDGLGPEDTIVNGDDLIEVLGKFKFDLFIHGHKHDPLLRYHQCHETSNRIPILSSGSFSATSNLSFTSKRNTLHKIDLFKDGNSPCNGRVKTWTFRPRNGWKNMYDAGGFHPNTGFGYDGRIEDLAKKILKEVGNSAIKDWKELVTEIPEINFLIPTQADDLEKELKKMKLILAGRICEIPECISNRN